MVWSRGALMSPKFKFEVIPIAEVPQESAAALSKRGQPLVLIVDDERIIADTLAMILSKSGFSTLTAYDGATALTLARDRTPDLLISDVLMPGMTGIELAISIKQTIQNCKILLFSGQAATVDLLEKARHDGYDFTTLTKPVHPTDMLKRISECLGTKQPSHRTVPNFATHKHSQAVTSLPN
jgi:CheY-like chemotaxis protein